MALARQFMTAEQFDAFVQRAANADKLFEFIGGEVFEVPSNLYCSKIAARILTFTGMFLLQHDIGHVTGEAGGYLAAGTTVWVVYPEEHEIVVHRPGQAARIFTLDDTLDGEDFLPGFALAVSQIFPQ